MKGGELRFEMGAEPKVWYCPDEPETYADQRPAEDKRLFTSEAVEKEIGRVCALLTNERLRWMFANCFPNTLDTTVHYGEDEAGNPDTYVYTGDIPAMWLRDSGAQVWPYVQLCGKDAPLQRMIAGGDPPADEADQHRPLCQRLQRRADGRTQQDGLPENRPDGLRTQVGDRLALLSSASCAPLLEDYGRCVVFDAEWVAAMRNIIKTLREQQRKEGPGRTRSSARPIVSWTPSAAWDAAIR